MSATFQAQGAFRPPRPGTFRRAAAIGVVLALVLAITLWRGGMLWGEDSDSYGAATADPVALDLSRPVFIRGALCPDDGLLAAFSDVDSRGCLVPNGMVPVTVVATAINGVDRRVFKVDMQTADGTVEGWVTSASLRN